MGHASNNLCKYKPKVCETIVGGVCPDPLPLDDIYAPTVPQNLIVYVLSSYALKILWLASVDNVGVQFYEMVIDGGDIINIGKPPKIGSYVFYIHDGLEPGSTHTYKVRAVDFSGNQSEWSETVEGTTTPIIIDTVPPAVPENLQANPDVPYSILVEWDSVPDGDLAGYYLLLSGGIVVDTGLAISYLHEDLVPCEEYHYRVRSYDDSGNKSPWSELAFGSTVCEEPVIDGTDSVFEGVDRVIEG